MTLNITAATIGYSELEIIVIIERINIKDVQHI